MGKFTRIPQNTFNELQLDAGIMLKNFDPANPTVTDTDIICATTGGIQVSCVPTFSDMGEDVDNCPVNMKELKHLDSWECTISFTSLGTSLESIKLALGAATLDTENNLVKPNRDLAQTDFQDVWWVGDKADGGMVAIKLINALSTGGFSMQTTKNGKGQISIELTGHVSMNNQDVMPMEFYSTNGSEVVYEEAELTGGFEYGVVYYTRSGAGTTESPYIYTEVAKGSEYDSSITYYVKA